MDVRTIDHVNLRIPVDGRNAALSYYVDSLGFESEGLERYESGDKPFFSIRLTPAHILHLWPSEEYNPTTGENFDHTALVVEEDIESVKATLDEAGIEIERELDSPFGATGKAPAVYIRDPFGYRLELKEPVE
jgi:catechol 2,3-dioxygenase-like lactoylglutathione lyase family enzyme